MSEDQKTDSPTPRRRRWPTVLLAASLTLNVLILGVIAGAHFRDDRDQRRSPPPDRAVLREGGFMPFFEAMPRESRRRMAEAFRDSVPGRGPDRTALVADFRNFVAALRAEPFERDALNEVLEAQHERVEQRILTGREIVLDQIAEMTPAERAAFADALEERFRKALSRAPGRSEGGRRGGD